VVQGKKGRWVQVKESFLWNTQNDRMEGQHYDLEKRLVWPSLTPREEEVYKVLTYMNYFGV